MDPVGARGEEDQFPKADLAGRQHERAPGRPRSHLRVSTKTAFGYASRQRVGGRSRLGGVQETQLVQTEKVVVVGQGHGLQGVACVAPGLCEPQLAASTPDAAGYL